MDDRKPGEAVQQKFNKIKNTYNIAKQLHDQSAVGNGLQHFQTRFLVEQRGKRNEDIGYIFVVLLQRNQFAAQRHIRRAVELRREEKGNENEKRVTSGKKKKEHQDKIVDAENTNLQGAK